MRLLLTTLRQRQTVRTITPLLNIPVWVWLRLGDEHVSQAQVRRALASWTKKTRVSDQLGAERAARRLVGKLAAPQARRATKKRLATELLWQQITIVYDPEALMVAARAVVDPSGSHPERGPVSAPLSAERYSAIMAARGQAISAIVANSIGPEVFEAARSRYVSSRAGYAIEQPQLSRDPSTGHIFDPVDAQNEVTTACNDLVIEYWSVDIGQSSTIGTWRRALNVCGERMLIPNR